MDTNIKNQFNNFSQTLVTGLKKIKGLEFHPKAQRLLFKIQVLKNSEIRFIVAPLDNFGMPLSLTLNHKNSNGNIPAIQKKALENYIWKAFFLIPGFTFDDALSLNQMDLKKYKELSIKPSKNNDPEQLNQIIIEIFKKCWLDAGLNSYHLEMAIQVNNSQSWYPLDTDKKRFFYELFA